MAKVAHRVSALEGQQLLVIHATADGERLTQGPRGAPPSVLPRALTDPVLFLSTEKIHFQHTAELITQLIKGKANYSLQVWGWPGTPPAP